MATRFIGFLVIVVLLFAFAGALPGILAGAGPLLFGALALLALLFVPSFRRFAMGLVVLAVVGGMAYSSLSEKYQRAKSQIEATTAAASPSSFADAASAWVRGLAAEDWQPFITGSTWKTKSGLSPSPCCIQTGDVQQGHLGDCWLLASLAAVAKTNPGAIRKMIQTNGDGTYIVTLFAAQNGQLVPRGIRINAVFPEYPTTLWQRLMSGESRFGYAQPGDDSNEAWVMLVEKAAAAVNGGYEKLDAGTGMAGLEMVTGRKVTAFEPRKLSPDALATKLMELERANYPVIAGTFPSDQIVEAGPSPLLIGNETDPTLNAGHMYYFIHYDPASKTVVVGNQHERNKTNELTLQQFQFAFTAVFYNDLVSSEDGCTCS